MTTPTQAQIEAELKAKFDAELLQIVKERNERVDWLISENDKLRAVIAAAHVGEPEIEKLKHDIEHYIEIANEAIKERNATIERCAQVVNECLIAFQKQHDEDDQFSGVAVAALIADLVIAIRNLKDKT